MLSYQRWTAGGAVPSAVFRRVPGRWHHPRPPATNSKAPPIGPKPRRGLVITVVLACSHKRADRMSHIEGGRPPTWCYAGTSLFQGRADSLAEESLRDVDP